MLKKIIPFEPVSAAVIPAGKQWTNQIKWDGVRIQTYFDGKNITLFNRRGHERTNHYPELCSPAHLQECSSAILDGEVISLDQDGLPSFRQVMKRDGIRKMDKVPALVDTVPILYMVFDIVYLNGEWIHNQPLSERLLKLERTVQPSGHVQIVQSAEDGDALFEAISRLQMEGIVCKDLSSKYEFGGKNEAWRKIKHFGDLIAVVGGVTYRGNRINSLMVGLYGSDGELHYISHVGTGRLTQKEWQELTVFTETIKIADCPFRTAPPTGRSHSWIRPVLTVKIQFMEWEKGHSLRQPSILSFVVTDPYECTFEANGRTGLP